MNFLLKMQGLSCPMQRLGICCFLEIMPTETEGGRFGDLSRICNPHGVVAKVGGKQGRCAPRLVQMLVQVEHRVGVLLLGSRALVLHVSSSGMTWRAARESVILYTPLHTCGHPLHVFGYISPLFSRLAAGVLRGQVLHLLKHVSPLPAGKRVCSWEHAK